MSTELTTQVRLDVAARMAAVADEINTLQGVLDGYKEQARQWGVDTYTVAGNKVLRVSPNRKFSVTKGVALLTDEQVTACTVSAPDPKKVKAQLPEALIELCMEECGEPKVALL